MQDYFFLQCDEIEVQFLLVFIGLELLKQIKTELITNTLCTTHCIHVQNPLAKGFSLILLAHDVLYKIMVFLPQGCFTNGKFTNVRRPDRRAVTLNSSLKNMKWCCFQSLEF